MKWLRMMPRKVLTMIIGITNTNVMKKNESKKEPLTAMALYITARQVRREVCDRMATDRRANCRWSNFGTKTPATGPEC